LNQNFFNNKLQIDFNICHEYLSFKSEHNFQALELVFASTYINFPPSSFGHLFFRLTNDTLPEQNSLTDKVISYGADITNPENSGLFMLKGLVGSFDGNFSLSEYSVWYRKYLINEHRDLWHYRVDLDSLQLSRLIDHLWEIQDFGIPYFFLTGNCAYHLLALLEVADFKSDYKSGFDGVVTPINVLKRVACKDECTPPHRIDVSRKNKVMVMYNNLSEKEKQLFNDYEKDHKTKLGKVSAQYKEFVLNWFDFNYPYLAITDSTKRIQKNALLALDIDSTLKSNSLEYKFSSPTLSHEQSKISIGAGTYKDYQILASYRYALHNLMDNPTGYNFETQTEFYSLTMALNPDYAEVRNYSLFSFKSITPHTKGAPNNSWMVQIQGQQSHIDFQHFLDMGIGRTFQISPEALYLGGMLNDRILFLQDYKKSENKFLNELGAYVYMFLITKHVSGSMELSYFPHIHSTWYKQRHFLDIESQLAWHISTNQSISIHLVKISDEFDFQMSFNQFF